MEALLARRTLLPGLLACLTVAMAASFLSDHYGGPTMLFALLLGMAFNFLHKDSPCRTGIEFCSRTVLRFGVVLLGARITFDAFVDLGWHTLVFVVSALVLTILFGWCLARWNKEKGAFGILTGGAVAICGASAALAISAVMPRDNRLEQDTLFTVIGVTTLSTVAMILYPMVSSYFTFSDIEAGIFLGGTIHDVAQVVGAGYGISEQAGDIATVTKLLRVTMLVPVVLVISLVVSRKTGDNNAFKLPLPLFLVGFVVLVIANSFSLLPEQSLPVLNDLSRACLVMAIAGLGMKTALGEFKNLGLRPIMIIGMETLFLAGLFLVALNFNLLKLVP